MLRTRILNDWTGAAYTMEEVAEMDWTLFEVLAAEKHAAMAKG
jgi:hypothetical protein